ncbi:MAG: O-succinylbenzoate synthase [Verrucomicrobiaceae bacterium]|nr:O-succinylbenzoate synthase [Verrucomicrobiaceae bacterium]
MIELYRYTLHSGAALNSASVRREFPGALIRVDGGHAAVHPWPEFGDATLEAQLEILASGGTTPLLERALHCASLDGEARRNGASLFEDLEVPQSHYSWSQSQPTEFQLGYLQRKGFSAIKVKGFANYGETSRFLDSCAKALPDLKLRVDFNGCLDRFTFAKFIEFMQLRTYRQLDLVEDPFPYDAVKWQAMREAWGVTLALDKGWKNGTTGFDAVVVKPARRDWRLVTEHLPGSTLILTSAMDHAVGQAYAAYEAALCRKQMGDKLSLCGLVTHHLFDNDAFFERLEVTSGVLQVDRSGTGLGFDDLLEDLPWEPLI